MGSNVNIDGFTSSGHIEQSCISMYIMAASLINMCCLYCVQSNMATKAT